MEPIISIVVPVYNVEQYLDKCISSLINQTFRGIEIILVNDGSTDKSPEICEDYTKNDSRVKTIHKVNGGLSDARNTGIRKARGEYILFVDSDDFIELDACERFIGIIADNKPDIVAGNARKVKKDKVIIMQHTFITHGNMVPGKEYLKNELKSGEDTMYMAAWLNLYNREFLLKNKLEFKLGLLHEDEQFTPRVFLKAEKVIGSDILFYNYIIRDGSITKKKDLSRNSVHIIQTCFELEKLYKQVDDEELELLLNDNLVNKYLFAFQIGALYRRQFKNLIDRGFVLRLAYHRKSKIKAWLFCFNNRIYFILNKLAKHINVGSN